MPFLVSSTYVHGYGKSGVVAVETPAGNLNSMQGSQDVFVAKYNTLGKALWSARIASTLVDVGYGIATDSSGNVYVTGQSGLAVPVAAYNSDGTAFAPLISNAGSNDVFIVKYNTDGFVQWVTRIASTLADIGYAIATDSSGNVYVTGLGGVGVTVTVYNSNGTAFGTTIPSDGGNDAFIVKYNTSGDVQWVARIASSGQDIGYGIATDSSGNVYVTGQNVLEAVAYNSDGTAFATFMPGGGGGEAFIVKYNTGGFVQWVARIGSTAIDIGFSIATDSSANVYITGQGGSAAVLTAYNSDGTTFATTIPNAGSNDTFIVKYNTNGAVQWVTRIASTGADVGYAIATDSSGNMYVTGTGGSSAIVTAYNSNGTAFATTIPNAGSSDAFIVKYNTSGFVQWVARIASTGADIGYAIATDSSGNVYVTGLGGGVVTAYNSDGTAFGTTIANSGGTDAFIVKYNTSGFVQWLTRLASPGADVGRGISVDSNSNVYVTGHFTGTQYSIYGQALSLFSTTPNTGSFDAFVVKYNTNGSPQWIARVASTGTDNANGITTDSSGNVYVTGDGGLDAVVTAYNSDGTAFSTTLANSGGNDAFIVKYNTSGFVQWVARVASTGNDVANCIVADSSGNVYVTGRGGLAVVTAFNSDGTAFATTIAHSGTGDAFIVKYNTNGFVQWVTRVASTGQDTGRGIATDSSGNLYVTGIGGTGVVITAFNSDGTAFSPTLANSGSFDAFFVKYNTSGFVQWVARVASTGTDSGYGIVTDSSGNVYVTGQGGGVVTAFNSNGTAFSPTLANSGSTDVFFVKYNTSGFVQWVARIASTGADIGYGIAADSSGNVYVTGQGGTGAVVTAFNSNGTAFSPTLANSGSNDAFLVKYNTNGFVQWVTRVASTAADVGYGIATDSSGNVYVTGDCGTISGSTAVTVFNSNGAVFAEASASQFVVKYDTNGNAMWFQFLVGTGGSSFRGASVDTNGNLCITALNNTTTQPLQVYNADLTPYKVLNSTGLSDVFIVKYSSNTTPLWAARVSSRDFDTGYGIATDSSGNVYVTGQGGSAAIVIAYSSDGTAFANTLPNSGSSDTYIVKYNTNGFVQWTARIGGNGQDVGYGIVTDAIGDLYVVGYSTSSVITAYNANGTAFATTITRVGGSDAFIVKYNTSGAVQWVTRVSSSSVDFIYGVTVDPSGNVYCTGIVGAAGATAYNSDGTAFGITLANDGNYDGFVVKYNTGGFVQWIARVATTLLDEARAIAVDSTGNVYITGYSGNAVMTAYNADGTAFATTIANAGGGDAFIVKYNTSGFVQWVASVASVFSNDIGHALATDSAGNMYITGQGASSTVTAYNSDGTAFATTIANTGSGDAFVVKYNTSGFVQWVTRIASTSLDIAYAIVSDSAGNIYITGYGSSATVLAYNSNGSIFGSAGPTITGLGTATFVVKYNSSGFAQWISMMNGSGSDQGRGIALDTADNLYVTGSFEGSALIPYSA